MIDIATLKEYIKVLEDSTLQAMELSDETDTIRLEKACEAPAVSTVAVAAQPVTAAAPNADAPAATPVAEQPADSGKTINAPIVGVFYAAPSPDSEPYAPVGKRVKKGDTVCIIEAMKCMNEIQAETDGEIVEVLVNNGELVEYDQPLFKVKS